jgi:hypothetical protein
MVYGHAQCGLDSNSLTIHINPADGLQWTEQHPHQTWQGRAYFGTANFDGKMWIIGGVDTNGNELADVWSSSDGTTWTQVTNSAAWGARQGFQVLVFNDKLWVIGGRQNGTYPSDVWSSSDGVSWSQVTEEGGSPWPGRMWYGAAVFGNQMWILGGVDNSTYYNDVWSSSDGGAWTQSAAPGWSGRFGMSVVAYNNKLWVIGGQTASGTSSEVWSSDDGQTWTSPRQEICDACFGPHLLTSSFVFQDKIWVVGNFYNNGNDVWTTTDGSTWTQVTAAAAWGSRRLEQTLVFSGELWLMGGENNDLYNDVWHSPDGVSWTEMPQTFWNPRQNFGSITFNGKMWVMGGSGPGHMFNDVWSSANGTDWTEVTNHAAWNPRQGFGLSVFDGKLWVMGGLVTINPTTGEQAYGHDVWSSSDGATWTRIDNQTADWDSRAYFGTATFDGKLWVFGGGHNTGGDCGFVSTNEIWSSEDGNNWVQAANADWLPRHYSAVTEFNGELWIMGGRSITGTDSGEQFCIGYDSSQLNDVWHSADGVHWTQATEAAAWDVRSEFAVANFNDQLWLFDGDGQLGDIWKSANGADWTLDTDSAVWGGRSWHGVLSFNNRLWIMGGKNTDGHPVNDIWASNAPAAAGNSSEDSTSNGASNSSSNNLAALLNSATTPVTATISLDDFADFAGGGHALDLTAGQVISFDLTVGGTVEHHTITVKEIGADYVIITIASEPFDLKLTIGESQDISVHQNGITDLRVKLVSITSGVAKIVFTKLHHPSPTVISKVPSYQLPWSWIGLTLALMASVAAFELHKQKAHLKNRR